MMQLEKDWDVQVSKLFFPLLFSYMYLFQMILQAKKDFCCKFSKKVCRILTNVSFLPTTTIYVKERAVLAYSRLIP
jgi:hypothetical protein